MGDESPTKNGGGGGGKYTPSSKRLGASGSGDGTIVLAAPARSVGVPMHYPQLTDTNYALWAVKMKVLLRPLGVLSAIEPEGEVDDDKDAAAFAAISQSVPDAVMMAIAGCKTARDAWETIRCMRVGEDRVKKARVKQLKRQLDRLEMDDGETVIVFAQKLTTLVSEIRSLGESISDEAVIEHLFSAVPDRFGDIVNTIEQWGDLSTMSVAEAVGRLAAFEESHRGRRRGRGYSGDNEGEKLMLVSRAQLEALVLNEKKKGEGSSSSDKNDHEGHNGGRGEKKKERRGKFDKSKITCFECGEKGHFASECDASKKEKVLLADVDVDDEPALLMAMACEHGPLVEHIKVDMEEKQAEITLFSPSMKELEAAKAEAERLHEQLAATEAKLHVMSHLCKAEAKDAMSTNGDEEYIRFLECVDAYEKEMLQAKEKNNEMKESLQMAPPAGTATPVATAPAAATVTRTGLECPAPEHGSAHSTGKRGNTQQLVPSISELCKVEVYPVTDGERIFLHEEKVKPKLASGDVDSKKTTWYLDSGASNHMTGCRGSFVALDESIKGSVKFGDDSVVKILGKGTVLLRTVSGQHILLHDVYFVSKLTSSILSLGQLDEEGCKSVLSRGFLSVFDRSGKLLARARKTKNQLYVLNLKKTTLVFDRAFMTTVEYEGSVQGSIDVEPA